MEANSKEHIPVSELEEIKRVVKEKKDDVEIREDHKSIIIEKESKKIEINEMEPSRALCLSTVSILIRLTA